MDQTEIDTLIAISNMVAEALESWGFEATVEASGYGTFSCGVLKPNETKGVVYLSFNHGCPFQMVLAVIGVLSKIKGWAIEDFPYTTWRAEPTEGESFPASVPEYDIVNYAAKKAKRANCTKKSEVDPILTKGELGDIAYGYGECRSVMKARVSEILAEGNLEMSLKLLLAEIEESEQQDLWNFIQDEQPGITREEYDAQQEKVREQIRSIYYSENGYLKPRLVKGDLS